MTVDRLGEVSRVGAGARERLEGRAGGLFGKSETEGEGDSGVQAGLGETRQIGAAGIQLADILPVPVAPIREVINSRARPKVFGEIKITGEVK